MGQVPQMPVDYTSSDAAVARLAELPAQQFAVNSGAESDVQGILVRSAAMHDTPLPEGLLAIARAGAGVNNIPVPACSEKGIVVFNTPGANANAVMELVLAGLVLASRDVAGGIAWAKTLAGEADAAKQVEKGKSQFAGPELLGKTLGVVGLGAIGVRVANLAVHLGMNVLGYDPYLSIDAAWSLSRHVHHCTSLSQLYSQSDYITLHLPATKDTMGMLDTAAFAQMKQGVRILNFARAELASAPALAQADVGIAMGGGSDVAIETAAITLMRHSLMGVADALAISKATLRNMKQNLLGAFIYNSLGIPIAAGILWPLTGTLLNPVVAGAAMALSSITVVSNANRLLRFKPKD